MSTIYDLDCRFDSHKSFYGKAQIAVADDGTETLYSYNTPVIKKRGNKITLGDYALCSNTTLRHCKEALRQWGYGPMSKKEIANTFEWERF